MTSVRNVVVSGALISGLLLSGLPAQAQSPSESGRPQPERVPAFAIRDGQVVHRGDTRAEDADERSIGGDQFLAVTGPTGELGIASTSLLRSENELSRAAAIGLIDRVELIWPEQPESAIVTVRRGERVVARGYGLDFYVGESTPGAETDFFVISSEIAVPAVEWYDLLEPDEITLIERGQAEPPTRSSEWGLQVLYPEGESKTLSGDTLQAVTIASTASSAVFVYRTFIASATAPSGYPACSPGPDSQYRFLGDNRGYSPTTGSHRTQAAVTFNWITPSVTIAKSVGNTHRQRYSSGVWATEATRNAGTSGIVMVVNRLSTSSALINLDVSVRNPFCSSLAYPIDAVMALEVTRAGNYSINGGNRRTVPHHEAYIKKNTSTEWKPVFRLPISSFSCLNPLTLCTLQSLAGYYGPY